MKKSFLALGLAFSSLIASAQENQDSISTVNLDEVYVIGVRAGAKDPITQSTIRKADLESIDLGQDAAMHLERLSPSIVTYSDAGTNFGNYMSIRLRGMAQDRVNVTLNGVPLNDMMDQGVFFSNFADFSNSIESVQVQRGVGTSSNGTSSYAGSINYQSISLYDEKPEAELRLSGGSFGSMGFAAEAKTGKNEKGLSAYARASRLRSQGYKRYSSSDAHSFFFSGGYMGEKHVLKFTGFMGKTQNGQSYTAVPKSVIDNDARTNLNNPNDVDDFEQDMAQLNYTYLASDELSISNTIYYSGARGFFPFGYDLPVSLGIPLDTTIALRDTTVNFDTVFLAQENYGIINNQYGLISNVSFNRNGLNLDAGLHAYTFDRRNTFSVSPNVFTPFVEKSFKNELALFVKANKRFGQLTVFADVQFRTVDMSFEPGLDGVNNSSESYSFLNPKAGLTYDVNEKMNAYFSFGRTGREPTRIDLFSNGFDIEEEYVNDFEFGYRLNEKNYALNVNAFYMDFENEITELGGVIENTYFEIRENVASSQRYGLELEGTYNATQNLMLGLMGTYMRSNVDQVNLGGEERSNQNQILSPELIITPQVQYTFFEKLSLNVNARYLSEAYTDIFNNEDLIIPSSFILNTGIDYRITENISAALFINNITDELYFTDGSPIDTDGDDVIDEVGFRVQAPRNFFGRLSVRF